MTLFYTVHLDMLKATNNLLHLKKNSKLPKTPFSKKVLKKCV